MIKRNIVLIICIFSLILCGCQRPPVTETDSKKTIDLIVKTDTNDFWKTVKIGAEAAGREFGVDINFKVPSSEKDIEGQINIVNDSISRKVDAIILAATDYKRLVNVSEKAIDSGIPIIVIDSAIDSSKVSCLITTDNKEAGRLLGKKLVEVAGEGCRLLIISFVKGAESSDLREAGLLSAIKEYPNIKVVDIEYSFSIAKEAEDITRRALSGNNVDAIVALNGPSAMGAAKAIKEMNLSGKVKVLGFDSTMDEIIYIEEGVIQATIVQDPYAMGYLGVKNAMDVINKKSVTKLINTAITIIDKNNMYTPENQKLLFPFIY